MRAKLDGVRVSKASTVFEDFRGIYVELWNSGFPGGNIPGPDFTQDDISISRKNVLRGIHGDEFTAKLIQCLYGSFYLVVVNFDKDSPQFLCWDAFTLSDQNHLQVFVPKKFGNGHLILSETAIFYYKQTTHYGGKEQFTIMWNDPALGIFWPIKNPILSERDSAL